MKKFPANAFKPQQGYLEQRIDDSSSASDSLCLTHRISFSFQPFKLENEMVKTMLELGSISLPVKTWKEISGRTFDFPVNPEDGYIDGSVNLFDAHNPADATKLKFGSFRGRMIPVSITLCIDFSFEGNKDYGVVPLQLDTVLELYPLCPFSWVQRGLDDDAERLTEAIKGFVNLDDYCEPVMDGKTIAYEPKC